MKLLFTGSSGFLGYNLKPILSEKYELRTLGMSDTDDYNVNIADRIPAFNESFDVILHFAGKAHVIPKNDHERKQFFDVNYQGTINICKGLENTEIPKSFIFLSTVAVYGKESGIEITEEEELAGTTPYAKSKIMAEKFLINWCEEHHVTLGILRPSLIAGLNPPGNLKSMICGIKNNKYFSIAGGKAQKSILMAQDIINLLPSLIERGGIYNVCDDEHPSFKELEGLIAKQLNKKNPLSIPYWLAKFLALTGDLIGNKIPINSVRLRKITATLTFSNEKAKRELKWQPLSVIENFKIEK